MMSPTSCHILAPAKINLGLEVLGKRPDGFHDIRTTFVALDLYDRLSFTRASEGGVRLDLDPTPIADRERLDFPLDERNLITRAVRLFEQQTSRSCHLHISVSKRIPTAAGLGGGSSDAAATLHALDLLYGTNLTPDTLMALGAQLGSDVPFFLNGAAAIGEGRGERLTPISIYQDWWALLVSPPIGLRAADIYGQLGLTSYSSPSSLDFRGNGKEFFSAVRRCHNDLESVAIRLVPELSHWQRSVRTAGAENVFVSGSGPTVAGIFRRRPAEETVRRLQNESNEVRVIVCRPVTTPTALVVE